MTEQWGYQTNSENICATPFWSNFWTSSQDYQFKHLYIWGVQVSQVTDYLTFIMIYKEVMLYRNRPRNRLIINSKLSHGHGLRDSCQRWNRLVQDELFWSDEKKNWTIWPDWQNLCLLSQCEPFKPNIPISAVKHSSSSILLQGCFLASGSDAWWELTGTPSRDYRN